MVRKIGHPQIAKKRRKKDCITIFNEKSWLFQSVCLRWSHFQVVES